MSKMFMDVSDLIPEIKGHSSLTNRSNHYVRKIKMREEAYQKNEFGDVWDIDYKSTSDEEDNDSDDEDDVKKKPRLSNVETQPKKDVDVVMELIKHDGKLVKRHLEAKLARIRRKQKYLKIFREKINITAQELTKFDLSEDYNWY